MGGLGAGPGLIGGEVVLRGGATGLDLATILPALSLRTNPVGGSFGGSAVFPSSAGGRGSVPLRGGGAGRGDVWLLVAAVAATVGAVAATVGAAAGVVAAAGVAARRGDVWVVGAVEGVGVAAGRGEV